MDAEPPFRADHVGSFLRPKYLLEARDAAKQGRISAADLRSVEDRAINEVVKFQQDLGLHGITDGEFRRTYFHVDFLTQLDGVDEKGGIALKFQRADGEIDYSPPVMQVSGRVRHSRPIQRRDFEYLK
jgi:5-methyltetrahydropteroyltriglutamate--homocysteine methyltransferase